VGASLGGLAAMIALGEFGMKAKGVVFVDIVARMEIKGVERVVDFMSRYPHGFDSVHEASLAVTIILIATSKTIH